MTVSIHDMRSIFQLVAAINSPLLAFDWPSVSDVRHLSVGMMDGFHDKVQHCDLLL